MHISLCFRSWWIHEIFIFQQERRRQNYTACKLRTWHSMWFPGSSTSTNECCPTESPNLDISYSSFGNLHPGKLQVHIPEMKIQGNGMSKAHVDNIHLKKSHECWSLAAWCIVVSREYVIERYQMQAHRIKISWEHDGTNFQVWLLAAHPGMAFWNGFLRSGDSPSSR